MSKVFKAIGKAFKAVVKVAKVVVPVALAVGAVVFTGGAALGVLPTFSAAIGGVVGGLGLSTALTGALTGAVVSAGFGAAVGGLTGGMKGMQKGALMGAATGGLLGAVNPATFGIVKGAEGVTTMNALRNGGNAFAAAGSKTALTTGVDGITRVASGATSPTGGLLSNVSKVVGPPSPDSITGAATTATGGAATSGAATAAGVGAPITATAPVAIGAPAAAQAGGGIGGLLSSNPMLAGQLISGAASAIGGGGDSAREQYEAKTDAEKELANFNYNNVYSGKDDPFGVRRPLDAPRISPSNYYTPPTTRYRYDPTTNTIVEARA